MNKPIRKDILKTTNHTYECEVYYNKGYDCEVWVSPDLALPVIKYKERVLLPYLRASKTLMYPIVNIPNHGEQYCHLIVAFSILGTRQYMAIKGKTNNKVVVDHKDGNVLNYNYNNLRYLFNKDNVKKRDGFMRPLTKKQYDLLFSRFDIDYDTLMNEKIHSIKLSSKTKFNK